MEVEVGCCSHYRCCSMRCCTVPTLIDHLCLRMSYTLRGLRVQLFLRSGRHGAEQGPSANPTRVTHLVLYQVQYVVCSTNINLKTRYIRISLRVFTCLLLYLNLIPGTWYVRARCAYYCCCSCSGNTVTAVYSYTPIDSSIY